MVILFFYTTPFFLLWMPPTESFSMNLPLGEGGKLVRATFTRE